MSRYVQPVADLPDLYTGDHVLRRHLDRLLGPAGHAAAAPLLAALAADVAGPLHDAHLDAERHPPELRQYDTWGARVDEVVTAHGWEVQRQAAARHGLVGLPYDDTARAQWGAGARVVQHALLHLYMPWSATYSCPVAMSDGAVATLRADGVDAALQQRLLPHLLSRDPERAWTSGQWMTETEGGSDVGRATTEARRDADGTWRLYGEKWFCSAITSELAIALARPEGAGTGTRGLACFVVPRYADLDAPRPARRTSPGLSIHRLKDKLGTRALPSAEVGFDGAEAWPVGDPGEPGLRRMLTLVQITRLHNAAAAAASVRRGLHVARAFAETRQVFGRRLVEQPLHREVLAWLSVDAEACYALTAHCFHLLGRVEVDGDAAAARELRIAATLAKALTARLAVSAASELIECLGGVGYIEDSGMPRLLRDAQVLPVWEGTTNVLSLDVVRALARDDALDAILERVDAAFAVGNGVVGELKRVRDQVADEARAAAADPAGATTQARARSLMTRLGDLLAAALLVEQARADAERREERGDVVASLWARRRLLGDDVSGDGHANFELVVDGG